MQYQRNSSSCSAAALQNALRIFGVRVGQHKIARIIGVNDDGADESDILLALDKLGCSYETLESNSKHHSERWLKTMAYIGPLILCVDNWGHWVSVAGGCRDRYWLFDPVPDPWNKAENGSWPVTTKSVLRRWKAARRRIREGGLYYGIAILTCDSAQAKRCAKAAAYD